MWPHPKQDVAHCPWTVLFSSLFHFCIWHSSFWQSVKLLMLHFSVCCFDFYIIQHDFKINIAGFFFKEGFWRRGPFWHYLNINIYVRDATNTTRNVFCVVWRICHDINTRSVSRKRLLWTLVLHKIWYHMKILTINNVTFGTSKCFNVIYIWYV